MKNFSIALLDGQTDRNILVKPGYVKYTPLVLHQNVSAGNLLELNDKQPYR